MSITGVVENDTIKLPLHVPDGTRVEIVLPTEVGDSDIAKFHAWLTSSIGLAKGRLTTEERMRETRSED